MKPVKTITCEHGVVIKIYQDIDAQSPNDWENEDAFLWSRVQDLAAGQSHGTLGQLASLPPDFDPEYDTPPYAIFNASIGYRAEQVYLVSGADVSVNFDDAAEHAVWNGKAFVFIKRASFPAEHDFLATARSVVDAWNTYLSGDVYGYVIEDAEGEELDSLWCLYGLDYAIKEAKEAVESHMPVARGRALLRKAADDVQRRLAHPPSGYPGLTWAADAIGGSLWAADTNGDVLAAVGRECPDYDKEVHSESYPYIVAVTAAWLDRYWPGD